MERSKERSEEDHESLIYFPATISSNCSTCGSVFFPNRNIMNCTLLDYDLLELVRFADVTRSSMLVTASDVFDFIFKLCNISYA